MNLKILFLSVILMSAKIVSVDSPHQDVLKKKSEDIQENELHIAQEIADELLETLRPHFPAAGLAAPQIGINRSVFIYSFNREPESIEVVINPSYEPIADTTVEGWEACFSAVLQNGRYRLAKVPRFAKIEAQYLDYYGEPKKAVLEGFAAKVFQHEYDHLQGVVNIFRKDAVVREFSSKEEMLEFFQEVKKEDSKRYE